MTKQYLERVWYFGGWSDQIAAGEVKPVRLAGRKIAVYRGDDGKVAAIDDLCPHRFAPLHLGRVEGRTLECGYHGLRFNSDGTCALNPHGAQSSALAVRGYRVAECHGAIWIWLSGESDPDDSMIPDLSELNAYPITARNDLPTMMVDADHQLIVDNLLDPTHAEYVHRGTLGGSGELNRKKPSITTQGHYVDVDWHYEGVIAVPSMAKRRPDADSVDSWISVRWYAPGIVRFAAGIMVSGEPRESGTWQSVYHILMPTEDKRSSYDVRGIRNFATDDEAVSQANSAFLKHAFNNEDKPMIEAQQSMMEDREFWDLRPALFASDEPAVRVRRIFDAMKQAELTANP